ncbi:MAG: NAD(P)H-dependent oxidoreductase [Candidatus Spechtbacteria bacterium]|nr:NAD(P)H-dependent oxidoreductase [Candidatus Spechtbacteria bacterium]
MPNDLIIPIILGTAREGRRSEKVAHFVLDQAKKHGFESEIIDVRDYILCATDNTQATDKSKQLSEIVDKADGLIVVTPEYNHSYPGELKMMMDQVYNEYKHKPVAFCGTSSGMMGGCRVIELLRLYSIELSLVPIRSAAYFANVGSLFNDDGSIKDQSALSAQADRLKIIFDELAWYAGALKSARNA